MRGKSRGWLSHSDSAFAGMTLPDITLETLTVIPGERRRRETGDPVTDAESE